MTRNFYAAFASLSALLLPSFSTAAASDTQSIVITEALQIPQNVFAAAPIR